MFRATGLSVAEGFFNYIYSLRQGDAGVQRQQLNLLITPRQTNLYMSHGNHLNRGHLAPKSDFIYYYSQRATYYYANSVPQWASINGGTWENIETAIRKLASSIGNLKVFTGTYGVLNVKKNQIHKYPLKLGEKIPVPRYMWKLVCDATGKCISYVVLNDPLGEVTENLCHDLSTAKLWGGKGHVWGGRGACCSPIELFQKMRIMAPVALSANTLSCNI